VIVKIQRVQDHCALRRRESRIDHTHADCKCAVAAQDFRFAWLKCERTLVFVVCAAEIKRVLSHPGEGQVSVSKVRCQLDGSSCVRLSLVHVVANGR
jgi:hypothetical protein